MARHTNWDKWMSENIRYALSNNQSGYQSNMTFSEYPFSYFNQIGWGVNYIDIVGKMNVNQPLKDSVVVEIKSSYSDFNTGKGQNFVGKYNFFATDYKFAPHLLELIENQESYKEIGLLAVQVDGTVKTILSAKHDNMEYTITSNFLQFDSDDEVELFFLNVEIPQQMSHDLLKPRPIEIV
ncbi:MAG: hypothetical protein ACI4GD_02120 [Lachnospiraceae bacterium]